MKIKGFLGGIFIMLIFSTCNSKKTDNVNAPVTIEINYGEKMRTVNTPCEVGLTCLEALQHVAIVETHPVNEYVFVTTIDSLKGVPGIKGWYYKVNRKPSNKLSINQVVYPGDTITWVYKDDVCSRTVNNK
ncbi:MAG: DUF4430 domain-containing protein [Bacteroidales bacterium]|nr:DUF4430 domain-containing protein [Bacteroidales bacterium]